VSRIVTAFGCANADLRVVVDVPPGRGETVEAHDLEVGPGGKALNQAVAAARMGATACFIGAVGTDAHGAMLVQYLDESGVEACVDELESHGTGAAMLALDAEGEITVIEVAGANATLDALSDRALHLLRRTAVLLVQLEAPLVGTELAATVVREAGGTVVLNAAPNGPPSDRLLELTDVLVIARAHAAQLCGMPDADPPALAGALRAEVPCAIVLHNHRHATLADAAGVRELPSYVAHVLDSAAVTDTFCGSLAAGIALGAPIDEAACDAMAAAALAVQRPGSAESVPTLEDVREYQALGRQC